MTDLGSWQPSAINNLGQICGNQSDALAILYSNGGTLALGTLDGWPYADAYALNDSGKVVGRSGVSNNEACSWSGTVAQDLGVQGKATSINNAGQIVGNYPNGGAWLYSGGTLQSISDLGNGWSSTNAPSINNNGQTLLNATLSGFPGLFVLTNGTAEDLNVGGPGCSLNDNGQFVGYDKGTTKAFHGTIVGPTVSELPLLPGYGNSIALSINNSGLIVGYAPDNAGGAPHAILWDNNLVYDLSDLIPEDSGWSGLSEATGINNSGQICGWGYLSGGPPEAFLLTPIQTPEPSTLILSVAALVCSIAYAWQGQRRALGRRQREYRAGDLADRCRP